MIRGGAIAVVTELRLSAAVGELVPGSRAPSVVGSAGSRLAREGATGDVGGALPSR